MHFDTFLFDMDGTLTASGEGIVRSVAYALEQTGYPEKDMSKLQVFIGPPLIEMFMEYTGMSRDKALEALSWYRKRYETVGIFENRPYEGILPLLKGLKEKGAILAVASSKPEAYIIPVLERFGLRPYFDYVVGATLDEKRTRKDQVIEDALRQLGLKASPQRALMIGDREHDALGAAVHGVPCALVGYGYGGRQELLDAKPLAILDTVEALNAYLTACLQD